MNKIRKLKLPDGGSFDLAIPEGFGEPPALNESVPFSKTVWIAAAIILTTAAAVAVVKALGSK